VTYYFVQRSLCAIGAIILYTTAFDDRRASSEYILVSQHDRRCVQVEPGAMLFPAIFFEPTNKEVLQMELGRTKVNYPQSALITVLLPFPIKTAGELLFLQVSDVK